MRHSGRVKLRNVLFPIWFLYLYPPLWLYVIPANFLIDSAVLLLAAHRLRLPEKKTLWKRCIVKLWAVGFAADFIGGALTLVLWMAQMGVVENGAALVLFPGTTLTAIPGTALAGFLIYVLNRKFTFRRTELTEQQVHKICLAMAVFTAPYLMLVPLYG